MAAEEDVGLPLARWTSACVIAPAEAKDTKIGLQKGVGSESEDACVLLELCRDLQNARSQACVYDKVNEEDRLRHCKQYLSKLHKLTSNLDERERVSKLSVELKWTTRITATRGDKDFVLRHLHQELQMSTAYMALQVRQYALTQVDLEKEKQKVVDLDTLKLCVQRLREAAGAFQASHDYFVAKRDSEEGVKQGYDIPSELCLSMCRCLSQMCLGEAQLVTAHRAEKKALSRHLVSALYVGAAVFFEDATKEIKKNTGEFNEIPDNLMKYLAFMSWLSQGRACEQHALHLQETEKVGEAITSFKQSLGFVHKCKSFAEDVPNAWEDTYEKECARVTQRHNKARHENEVVHFQKEAKVPSPCPEPKQVVSLLPFEYQSAKGTIST